METNAMPSASYSQNGVRSGSGSTSNHGRLWLEFKASLDRTQNTNPYSYFGKLTVSTKYLPSLTLFLLLDTCSTEMNADTGVDGHTGAKDGSVVSVCCESLWDSQCSPMGELQFHEWPCLNNQWRKSGVVVRESRGRGALWAEGQPGLQVTSRAAGTK